MNRLCLVVAVVLFLPLTAQADSVRTVTAAGTGFVVDPDGYILTNEHVIHEATNIQVFVGGEDPGFVATVVEADASNDLALLKIDCTRLPSIPLGDSDSVYVLDPVLAVGYPASLSYGRDLTSADGRITAVRTGVPGREGRETFQTDAAIFHGSSGGPLLNDNGEVIGVNTAGIEGSEFYFAVPINDALDLLDCIPGFDPSSMGQASGTLSQQEILQRASVATVYIQVEIAKPLSGFLPTEALGSALTISKGEQVRDELGFVSSPGRRFNYYETIRETGYELVGEAEAFSASQYGDIHRAVSVIVFEFPSSEAAQDAEEALIHHRGFLFLDSNCTNNLAELLISDARPIGSLQLHEEVRLLGFACDAYVFNLDFGWGWSGESEFVPGSQSLRLHGCAFMQFDQLVFVIQFDESESFETYTATWTLGDQKFPQCSFGGSSIQCKWRKRFVIEGWIPEKEYTYTSALDPEGFLEDFDELIQTALAAIAD